MKRPALALALGIVATTHLLAQQQPVRLSLAEALARAEAA